MGCFVLNKNRPFEGAAGFPIGEPSCGSGRRTGGGPLLVDDGLGLRLDVLLHEALPDVPEGVHGEEEPDEDAGEEDEEEEERGDVEHDVHEEHAVPLLDEEVQRGADQREQVASEAHRHLMCILWRNCQSVLGTQ